MRIRLHHYLAECGIASRRKSEAIIDAGHVTVNGRRVARTEIIESDYDRITVHGREVTPAPKIYYCFHKPVNVVCSASRNDRAPIVVDYIRAWRKMHLFTVGRLDKMSAGLIFITNDGDFAHHVLHPAHEIEKEYLVTTRQPIATAALAQFSAKRHNNSMYRITRYRHISKTSLCITVTEGKHHEIRNIMRACNCDVATLTRIRIATITLGDLKVGRYRELSAEERRHISNIGAPTEKTRI